MEVFCVVLLKISLLCNFLLFRRLNRVAAYQEILHKETHEYINSALENIGALSEKSAVSGQWLCKELDTMHNKIDQLSLDLKTTIQPIQPTRKNNLDSMKRVFSFPAKVVVDE